MHDYTNRELQQIGNKLNQWPLLPCGTEGYRTAEVIRGGVDVGGVSSKTMQVTDHQGLYFIGEALDLTVSARGL